MAKVGGIHADLTAQTAQFTNELRKASRQIDGFARSASSSLGALNKTGALVSRGLATIGIGFGVGAAVSFVKNVVNTVGGLEELSQQLGISTDQLQVYRFAASQSGVSASELETSIMKLNRSIGDAAEGNKTAIEAFDKLGVKILDANKKIRPTGDILEDVAAGIAAIKDPAARAAIGADLMGRSFARLLPLFADGGDGMKEFEKRARELGLVIDRDTIKKFDDAEDKISAAWQTVVGFAAVLIADALPKIIEFGKDVVEVFTEIKAAIDAIERFIEINVKINTAGDIEGLRQMFGVAGEKGTDAQWYDNKAGTGAGLSADRMAELIQQEIDANNAFLEAQRAAAGAGVSGRYGRAKYKTSPGHQQYLDRIRRFVREEHLSGGPMTPTGPVIDITDGTLIDGRITGEGERHLGTPGGGTVGDSNPLPTMEGGAKVDKIDRAAEMVKNLQFQLDQMARSPVAQEIAANLNRIGVAADSAVGQQVTDLTTQLYTAEQQRAEGLRGYTTDLEALTQEQQREHDLLLLTDKEREIERVLLEAAQAARRDYAAGLRETIDLLPQEAAGFREVAAASFDLEASLERQKELQEDAAEAAKDHAEHVRDLGDSFGRDLASGLADATLGMKNFGEVALDMLGKIADEIMNIIFARDEGGGGGSIFEKLLGGLFGGLTDWAFGGSSAGGSGDDVFSLAGNMPALSELEAGGGSVFNIDARGADVAAVARLERAVDDMNTNFEPRAQASAVQGRRRGGAMRRAFDGPRR